MSDMFITAAWLTFEVDLRLVPPHEAEMILSNYRREIGEFAPETVKLTWSQLGRGSVLWPTAEVHGRRTIKRGARATVKYEEDENGLIQHWPLYVRDAFYLARDQVLKP